MERVLAPQKWSSHILLQRRNANLMSFWKYNKGSSSKTFASHKVSRFLYNECWNYISFFRQQLSFWPWLSTCIVGCLGEILPRLLLWMRLEYDYYRTADFQVYVVQECILYFALFFCITSGSMNSNCIFVVSIQLRWPPKRSIIHFVPNLKLQ